MRCSLPILLIVTPLMGACSELEPFLPKVSFNRFDVERIDFESTDVDFVFKVDNPNPINVKLSSFSYGLGFEQVSILNGDNEDGFQLEASGDSDLVLPVHLIWLDAWNLVQATKGEDMIDFALDGHVGFNVPELGEARVPYKTEDSFPAVRTPKFKVAALRAGKADWLKQELPLELDLGVNNDHASTLFFDQFDYGITLGENNLATGVVSTLAGVDGATEETITLPIVVDLLGSGLAIVDAIASNEPLKLGITAKMDVRTPFLEDPIPLSIDELGNLNVGGL